MCRRHVEGKAIVLQFFFQFIKLQPHPKWKALNPSGQFTLALSLTTQGHVTIFIKLWYVSVPTPKTNGYLNIPTVSLHATRSSYLAQRVECLRWIYSVVTPSLPYLNINMCTFTIRESVDSLCRDGADAHYMQYLSKSRITSPQIR